VFCVVYELSVKNRNKNKNYLQNEDGITTKLVLANRIKIKTEIISIVIHVIALVLHIVRVLS